MSQTHDLQEQAGIESDPGAITERVLAALADAPDERLRFVLQRLVAHVHAFVVETRLTTQEWAAGIDFLTASGQMCSETRQELVLLSDTLGLSMVVDAVANPSQPPATEHTVLGPFHAPDAPWRPMGASIIEAAGSGDPALVSGVVRSIDGLPIAGAVLDVWQNAANRLYAVQDAAQPSGNLRGRFRTGDDGRFWFWSVRPTDYTIPDDGPVGKMLAATARHPWRPAHLHLIVEAAGLRTVTTHFFDDESPYLDSDAVFGVKPSLVCHFDRHDPAEPGAPSGWDGAWYTLRRDVVLAPV